MELLMGGLSSMLFVWGPSTLTVSFKGLAFSL